ncbi:MAG: glycosyltransferase, partial [Cyanobacteria bacterium J06639_1]
IVEGYAYGVPAIVSQVGGATELIEDGQSGYTYDSSSTQLAEKMQLFISQPDAIPDMSAYCLEMARAFSTEVVRDRYIDVYKSVLESAS